jgi:hypothetical protein
MPVSCKNQITSTEDDNKVYGVVNINRIYDQQKRLISDSEFVIVQSLFQKNNLSLSNLQTYRLLTNHGWRYVRCYQYYHGLELFTNDVVIIFDSLGIYSTTSGDLISSIPIDTIPGVKMKDAGILFYDQIVSDPWYKDSLNSFRSRGFSAELGIYNLNAGTGDSQMRFVLTWKITVTNRGDYPVGYVRADSQHLIYYSNGIVIG